MATTKAPKKKKITKAQFEDCMVQTVAAYAMLADLPERVVKPRLSAQGFILLVSAGRTEEVFEICQQFKDSAAETIERTHAKVMKEAKDPLEQEVKRAEAKLTHRILTDLDSVAGMIYDRIKDNGPQSLRELRDTISDTISEMIANEMEVDTLNEKEN